MTSPRTAGRYLAYASLYVAVFGFALIAISDSECRNGSGTISFPGHTGAPIAFVGGGVLALVALGFLSRERRESASRRWSSLAWACASLALGIALLDFFYYLVKGAFACGIGLI